MFAMFAEHPGDPREMLQRMISYGGVAGRPLMPTGGGDDIESDIVATRESRTLVGTAEKESSSFGGAVAASRVCDDDPAKSKSAGPPLTPQPHAGGVVSLKCA
jgi:hypothetical protein